MTTSSTQQINDDPTAPFWGRIHQHLKTGETGQIRLLREDDTHLLSGRPGVDYRLQQGYRGSEDASVITPKQFQDWEKLPLHPQEEWANALYRWMESNGIRMMTHTQEVADWSASGISVGIIWGFNPPESAEIYLGVRAPDGQSLRSFINQIRGLLQRLGVENPEEDHAGSFHLRFPARLIAHLAS